MSNTIYHFQHIKENRPKLSQIRSYGIFSKGLKNEFETAVANEPSVFEPFKFYCIYRSYGEQSSNLQLLDWKSSALTIT